MHFVLFFVANQTYHAFSMAPFCLYCCFRAFNVVKRSFNFFVSHIVSNSSIHFSSMSVLNFSAHFCGLNLVFACFKTSFMLVTSLSLQKQAKIVVHIYVCSECKYWQFRMKIIFLQKSNCLPHLMDKRCENSNEFCFNLFAALEISIHF